MKYIYLIFAGFGISFVHLYLYWRNRRANRYSLSEYAISDCHSQITYFLAHLLCDVLFTLYSYQLFIVENDLPLAFYLNIIFVVLDFLQAALPSRGKTETMHFAAAYISWVSYLTVGVLVFFKLPVAEPYRTFASMLLLPILGMFVYMHFKRVKLYPYQLAIVPLFVIYMLIVTLGNG